MKKNIILDKRNFVKQKGNFYLKNCMMQNLCGGKGYINLRRYVLKYVNLYMPR